MDEGAVFVADHEVRADAVVVRAAGDIDSNTVPTLVECLKAAVAVAAEHPARLLVVDLQSVDHFGSAGLNAMLICQEHSDTAGVAVRLIASRPEVVRPIEVTNLTEILDLYPTMSEAVGPPDAQGRP